MALLVQQFSEHLLRPSTLPAPTLSLMAVCVASPLELPAFHSLPLPLPFPVFLLTLSYNCASRSLSMQACVASLPFLSSRVARECTMSLAWTRSS